MDLEGKFFLLWQVIILQSQNRLPYLMVCLTLTVDRVALLSFNEYKCFVVAFPNLFFSAFTSFIS